MIKDVRTSDTIYIEYAGANALLLPVSIGPDDTGASVLSATLSLSLSPTSDQYGERYELQVAEWANGAVVVPEGRFRPLTLSALSDGPSDIQIDVLPIFEQLEVEEDYATVWLILGRLESCDPATTMVELSPLDGGDLIAQLSLILE